LHTERANGDRGFSTHARFRHSHHTLRDAVCFPLVLVTGRVDGQFLLCRTGCQWVYRNSADIVSEARLRSNGQSGLDGPVCGSVRRNNARGFPLLEMILLLCKCSHAVPCRQRSSSQAIYHVMLVGNPVCRRAPGGCILRNKKIAAPHPSKPQPAGSTVRRTVGDRSIKDNQ
jgi:hypothetical protein